MQAILVCVTDAGRKWDALDDDCRQASSFVDAGGGAGLHWRDSGWLFL